MSAELRITEIFYSLQGEARTMGRPTVFVRLTGCPLRCQYCDTEYAFNGGNMMTISDIVAEVQSFRCPLVTVTGGEPLAQPGARQLMAELAEAGLEVSLETSGAMDIADIDERVSVVMDLKTPDSGELARNRMENIALLQHKDQVKFVICSRQDYEWARMKLDEFQIAERVSEVLFSPSYDEQTLSQLAAWVLEDRLPVRVQLQMHKLIWGDKPGV